MWNGELPFQEEMPRNSRAADIPLQYTRQSEHSTVKYLRNEEEIAAANNCSSASEVLAWLLMGEVNSRNGSLMVTYGTLVNVHRETDFVNKDGKFIDDDIDLWALLATVRHVLQLEPELFRRFGWTMRTFVTAEKYVIFLSSRLFGGASHEPSLWSFIRLLSSA
jgi:hypothetical protein